MTEGNTNFGLPMKKDKEIASFEKKYGDSNRGQVRLNAHEHTDNPQRLSLPEVSDFSTRKGGHSKNPNGKLV